MASLAEAARRVAARYLAGPPLQDALARLGAHGDEPLAHLDAGARLAAVNALVRGVRGWLSVAEAAALERELAAAFGAPSSDGEAVEIKDAISVITLRNHVGTAASASGLSWSAGMQVQSALSEVARFLAEHGGGAIHIVPGAARLRFQVDAWVDPGAVGTATPAGTPPWLIGVAKLSSDFRRVPSTQGARFQFTVAAEAALVA